MKGSEASGLRGIREKMGEGEEKMVKRKPWIEEEGLGQTCFLAIISQIYMTLARRMAGFTPIIFRIIK